MDKEKNGTSAHSSTNKKQPYRHTHSHRYRYINQPRDREIPKIHS